MRSYTYTDGLETERLVTRFLAERDIQLWSKFFEDEEAIEFHPNTEQQSNIDRSKKWIEKQLGRYHNKTYGHQALIDKLSNEMVGQCGLLLQDVDGVPELEVGYHIFRKFWGMGYAPEAAQRFRDYGFENDQEDSIVSLIDIHNIKSQRVAQKNGMIRERQLFRAEHDIFIYRIEKEEWLKLNP